jgi:hypothetical protein
MNNAPISLIYSYEAFAMRNQSNFTLDVRDLKFVRGSDDGTDEFYGNSITGMILPPGQCVLIVLQGRRVEVPSAWGCEGQQVHNQQSRPAEALFWRTEGTNTTFEVRLNDRVIAVCSTVIRAQTAECKLDWSALAEGAAG